MRGSVVSGMPIAFLLSWRQTITKCGKLVRLGTFIIAKNLETQIAGDKKELSIRTAKGQSKIS